MCEFDLNMMAANSFHDDVALNKHAFLGSTHGKVLAGFTSPD
jgi:hypothetical protein